jgi:hypothetical protein
MTTNRGNVGGGADAKNKEEKFQLREFNWNFLLPQTLDIVVILEKLRSLTQNMEL